MSLTRGPRALLLASSLLLSLTTLVACGDEEGGPAADGPATSGSPSMGQEPGASCEGGIPASVVAGLGWDDSVGATEDRGGCLWEGDQGSIWVLQREGTWDDACEELADTAPSGTFEDEVTNDAGVSACGYLRDEEVGQSEIAVDESGGRVMTVVLAAVEPTDPADVRTAMSALAATTTEVP